MEDEHKLKGFDGRFGLKFSDQTDVANDNAESTFAAALAKQDWPHATSFRCLSRDCG